MKNSQIISDIINDLRSLNIDDRISERYILSTLRYFNALFLKRENDQLRLYKYENIWTPIECLDMIESNISECSGVKKVYRYMKSKSKLPELYSYSNGSLIKDVLSLDDFTIYKPITLKGFKAISSREFTSKDKYYWMRDGHLIIPDGPEKVTLNGCFIDPSAARIIDSASKSACVNPMDEEFSSPPHLIETIKSEVLKRLMGVYKRVIEDEVGDLDSNIKTEKK